MINIPRPPFGGLLFISLNSLKYTDILLLYSPKDVDEVRRILSLANRLRFPLWTTSRGKNLG